MSNSSSAIRGLLLAVFSLLVMPQLFAITVSPVNPTVKEAATQQFTASTAATWKTSCDSITSGGLFTASDYPGSCTVTATATNGSGSATSVVNIVSPITMTPQYATTPQGKTQQFTASTAVTWTITTANCGSITAGGLFTASQAVGARCTVEGIATSSPHYTVWGSDTATAAGSFSISPLSPSVAVSKTVQFSANSTATWAASCGSITSGGLFTAPSTTGSCTITGTSSSGAKASTTATITAAAGFSVSPASVSVSVNATQQFTATAAATWATSCGSISSSGFFTAPSTTGSCTITATSSSGAKATAKATITAAVTGSGFILYPNSTYVLTGTRQTFQGQFTNEAPDTHPLTYSVDGIAGGNGTAGTITSAGLYTPPSSAGKHTVTAKDTATGLSASATVMVYSQVAVNFGSRTSLTSYVIPPYLLGAERMDGLYHQADLDLVTAAGVKTARFYAQIPVVFKTQTPNWGSIDSTIREMSAAGVHVLLQMHQTPPWLQTASSSCTGTAAALTKPSDVNAWGKLAAQYVAHMDANFPGVVTDYEIWNEPNTNALCNGGTYDQKNAFYQTLFAAAAPLMEAQAKADHATISVGGPATAGLQPAWVKALLSNPKTAPYVQFMSYHDYMFDGSTLKAQWDTYNGTYPVYELTQNTAGGPYGKYLSAAALVNAGSQPLGRKLPLYLTEYNMNSSFSKNCCQNDYTFAPVWNGIYVSDLLNAAYGGATTGIAKMIYFAANAKPYFCLIGTIDSNMDCAYTSTAPPQPYPSYFLYQLFFSPSYLGLESGGNMALSVTPGNSGGGLVVTAFYDAAQDAIVITNPTAANYASVPVSITSSGYSSGTAKLYQIVSGRSISSSSLALTSAGGTSYTAHIPVPPYSVQAISIK